jgi:peptide deformylase
MVTIVQSENKVLRKISKEVPISSIKSPKIQKILHDMSEALDSQYDGVAIAAPQIGVSLRIFVVSSKIFDEDFIRGQVHDKLKETIKIKKPNLVFINPILKKISKDKKLMSEGCLSVRPIYGKVRRATRASVEAYNEHGHKFTKDGAGLLAHIFQHENDHLDGILFTDKAKDLKEFFDNE